MMQFQYDDVRKLIQGIALQPECPNCDVDVFLDRLVESVGARPETDHVSGILKRAFGLDPVDPENPNHIFAFEGRNSWILKKV